MAAQITVPNPMSAIEVFPDVEYTSADVPASADYVVCSLGVRIKDSSNNNTPMRGLRAIITHTETPAVTPKPNVPYIFFEGQEYKFTEGYSYKFLDRGIFGFGKLVTI